MMMVPLSIPLAALCIVGKPVIFIPSPNVAEDHQTKNAMAVTKNKAAITIAETQLEEEFESAFFDLLKNESKQKELSKNIKKMALPNATSSIVDEIEKLIIRKA